MWLFAYLNFCYLHIHPLLKRLTKKQEIQRFLFHIFTSLIMIFMPIIIIITYRFWLWIAKCKTWIVKVLFTKKKYQIYFSEWRASFLIVQSNLMKFYWIVLYFGRDIPDQTMPSDMVRDYAIEVQKIECLITFHQNFSLKILFRPLQ